jgi:hypothetical protein
MRAKAQCVFCDKPAKEWHHVAGRNNCNWFCVPLCVAHHRLVTRAYGNANPAMMNVASDVASRMKHAREACLVLLWLLDHPEQIDPERIMK